MSDKPLDHIVANATAETAETFEEVAREERNSARKIEGAVSFHRLTAKLPGMNMYYAVVTASKQELAISVPLFGTYRLKAEEVTTLAVPDHDENALVIQHIAENVPETLIFYPKLFPNAAEVLPFIKASGFHPEADPLPEWMQRQGSPLRLWLYALVLLPVAGGPFGASLYFELPWLQHLTYLLPGVVTLVMWFAMGRWKWARWALIKTRRHWREGHPWLMETGVKMLVFFVFYWVFMRTYLVTL